MTAKGYDYRTPLDPPHDPRFAGGLPAAEIATATADVACKKQANVVGVWFAVESAYQKRLVAKDRDVLRRLRRFNLALVRRAAQVAGS